MVKNSPIFTGVLIGVLANVVKLGVNYLGYLLDFTDVVFWQLVSTMTLPEEYLFATSTLSIGAITDLTVASFLGVLFLFFIQLTGFDFLFLKGIGFAMMVRVLLFHTLLGDAIEKKLPQNPSDAFVTIATHFFFGVALAVFTFFLYQPEEQEQS